MKTTPLHAAHIALGAKMGEFAGYDMPLYYGEGVIKEHEWTRTHAGLFDVSHMGQMFVTGAGATAFWEHVTPSSFANIPGGRAKYSVLTNERGGTVDDLIVTRMGPDKFFAVVNAGCKDKDFPWLQSHLPSNAQMDIITDRALIALQGPDSERVIRDVLGFDASLMPYMWMAEHNDLLISRLGYTGEDGFEISIPERNAEKVWNAFMAHEAVKPVGLAARDSLRLEMGYPLYGHELDEDISAVEAGLNWIIAKDHTDYIGAEVIRAHLANGTEHVRVGVRLTDKGVAREGAEIRNEADEVIGMLSSGGYSPSTQASIGMGYIQAEYAETGHKIFVNVRGRNIAAEVCALPFVSAKTKSMKKKEAA
ncbi:glycine cleavage system aminomethyltransferase GcvT [Micavibrio aeruginosavorus]|uniref:aminomethyltransferase n=1 Tax=Micavibrio aeruginosavorus EPB TaxID=349215 RepID=M4VG14_9BACT|nr:glycine cleavage system aminomethyltransferase GcvT [Micavibrio aeruginosavorus]AGH98153.1 Aminomethyltransferase (glycine cleavage system T protein) [Micavibrio aeruginosavorus EPB]